MMRILLISDIHANATALETVIENNRQSPVDTIVCLGDIVTLGPEPHETLRLLKSLDCPCVMGNHDAFMLEPELIHNYTDIPLIIEAVKWARNQLTTEDFGFIRSFRSTVDVMMEGVPRVLCVHGSPISFMDNILSTTDPVELDDMLTSVTTPILACGHTHIQMLRQHQGMWIVNPGSVGVPFKTFVNGETPCLLPFAEYAVIELNGNASSIALHRVELDQTNVRNALMKSDFPLRDFMISHF